MLFCIIHGLELTPVHVSKRTGDLLPDTLELQCPACGLRTFVKIYVRGKIEFNFEPNKEDTTFSSVVQSLLAEQLERAQSQK